MQDRHRLTPDDVDALVATRRELHRHPERTWQEEGTARRVTERLRALGYGPRTGVARHGVTALLEGETPGPCVLLRADMDALPIREATTQDFPSVNDGVMHACGHDGHMAIALGAATLLRRRPPARGAVKLVFQPAEEGGGGARAMLEAGVLEDPPVTAAFGLHVWSHLDAGKVGVVDGPCMGAVDRVAIRVRGRGGHAALPHQGRDPIVAAAAVVTALQTVVSRRVDPLAGGAVVSIGRIRGGETFNVIPDEVVLEGTARCFDEAVWDAMPGWIREIAGGVAAGYGCTVEVEIERLAPATVNDPGMAALVREVAGEVVGPENVVELRVLASEDFSEFLRAVPGCFFFLGTGNEAKGTRHDHHTARFDLDEDALPAGAEILAGVAERYLATGD